MDQAKDLKPVVISSQRSGLNSLRICIESLTGKRTPGKTLLVETGPTTFVRTHDPASPSGKDEGTWREIDDQNQKGAGGSMSRHAADPHVFHQTILREADKSGIADHLRQKTSVDGRTILERYLPSPA